MMETVFETSIWSNNNVADYSLRILFGVVLFATLLPKGLKERKKKKSPETMIGIIFPVVVIPFWIVLHSFLLWNYCDRVNEITKDYEDGKCSIVEGTVEVLHAQASNGHDSPDRIRIGGKIFDISHFEVTPYYRNTVNNNGVLRNGVYARITHRGNNILKVEIENEKDS